MNYITTRQDVIKVKKPVILIQEKSGGRSTNYELIGGEIHENE